MSIPLFLEGKFQPPKGHEEDIKHIRDWLKGEPHLPTALSDEHLYLFLNSCAYQLTKTKETIENFFTLRTHAPDLFSKRDPKLPEIQAILDICNLVPIKWTSPEGYKVVLFRLVDYDVAKFNFVVGLKMFFMYIDMILAETELAPGYFVIFDLKGVTLGHLTKVSIAAVRKAMAYVQDCQPTALKTVYVINTVSFIDKIMALVKPFINSELLSILKFHGPPSEIGDSVPLEIFPEEYGGKGESAVSVHARQRALMENEYCNWFLEQEKLKVDESKRVGKKHPYTEIFGGPEGSFRKLDID